MTWTIEALSEHFHRILEERDHRYQQRFDAQEKALAEAKAAAERRESAASNFWTLAIAGAALVTGIAAIILALIGA